MVTITSDFDHGNIRIIDSNDPSNIHLEIEKDGAADFHQWFYFSVESADGKALTMRITNANTASYTKGWENYRAAASYDGENWFRVDTAYDGETLAIRHTPEKGKIYYAYFAAYPTTRYRDFMEKIKGAGGYRHEIIGETLDGQMIDYFSIGEGPKQMWVIARQHPGESMGSWWIEGFLPALAGDSETARNLREAATVHVIPCMNLDGSRRGHLRTNAAGVDLNRAWRNTTMDKSPEVFLVRNRMRETGVDFFLDVHGDEAIPNNFLNSARGIPSWDDEHESRYQTFCEQLLDVSEDFQTKDNYPDPKPGEANLDIATNYVAETWGCLSMTLEMPFKDAKVNPMPDVGWSPERCRNFAREHLEVMARVVGGL